MPNEHVSKQWRIELLYRYKQAKAIRITVLNIRQLYLYFVSLWHQATPNFVRCERKKKQKQNRTKRNKKQNNNQNKTKRTENKTKQNKTKIKTTKQKRKQNKHHEITQWPYRRAASNSSIFLYFIHKNPHKIRIICVSIITLTSFLYFKYNIFFKKVILVLYHVF